MVLSLDPWPVRFKSASRTAVYLFADQNFRVVEHATGTNAGQHKVTTTGYIYSVALVDDPDQALYSWHWHPRDRSDPHVHVRSDLNVPTGSERHLPTGRVAFEQVIRFLISDFEVLPADGWEARLAENEELFKRHRTWG